MGKPKEEMKALDGQATYKKRFAKNANYDARQDEPGKRMGESSFANLPNQPMYAQFMAPEYRDGIINSFTCGVSELSGIDENHRD
jgi:hypothetical protein